LVTALNAIPHIRARTDDNRSANDRRRPEFRKSRKGAARRLELCAPLAAESSIGSS
jgi:hypothetical protein